MGNDLAYDVRWDSRLLRVYEEHELVPRTRHDGTVELGYPRAWEACPHCKGTGHVSAPFFSGADTEQVRERCGWCHGTGAIKHLVRELTGHRCIRCGHPYRNGQEAFYDEPAVEDSAVEAAALQLFEHEPTEEPRVKRQRPVHWTPCDALCTHRGLIRWFPSARVAPGEPTWITTDLQPDDLTMVAMLVGSGREVQAAWRILTVHHANEHKADCRWWNLLALCQRCHLSVQSRVQMDRVWPHEHSEWFRPYVAGFYAWRYEQRDVTRREAVERMEELLAYERQEVPSGG